MVAGAVRHRHSADLGARTIREEIDAMRVLGIDPIQRLVVAAGVAFDCGGRAAQRTSLRDRPRRGYGLGVPAGREPRASINCLHQFDRLYTAVFAMFALLFGLLAGLAWLPGCTRKGPVVVSCMKNDGGLRLHLSVRRQRHPDRRRRPSAGAVDTHMSYDATASTPSAACPGAVDNLRRAGAALLASSSAGDPQRRRPATADTWSGWSPR